jgi:hypothetical protein
LVDEARHSGREYLRITIPKAQTASKVPVKVRAACGSTRDFRVWGITPRRWELCGVLRPQALNTGAPAWLHIRFVHILLYSPHVQPKESPEEGERRLSVRRFGFFSIKADLVFT